MIRSVNGKTPKIHPGAFVSEAAYVVGDVEIGEGSSVWPGTVIRGDSGKIVIGRRTCIQDNSVVHGDADVEIGDDVVIGHRVLCHARKVGSGTLLGNGCIVNDGVVIGAESLVASGAMVVDRMEVPARSVVVGMPA
ncbi:MAG: gamma carbonic anhydrase family protein, partial [SAR202 cluster bacterium]|nr:gamma carbonic anhydrase family protein [SAR202 cluster bacterium]